MSIIIIIIAITICTFSYIIERKVYSPVFLFTAFIGCISFLASLRLYNTIEISNKTYIVIIFGIIGFAIGGIFCYQLRFTHRDYKIDSNNTIAFNSLVLPSNELVLRSKMFSIITMCLMSFSAMRLYSVIGLLRSGYSLDYIRMVYFGTEVQGVNVSHFTGIIETYINLPCLYGFMPIIILEIFKSKDKRNIGLLTITSYGIWFFLSSLVSGGRLTIYIFAIELLFYWQMVKKRKKTNRRTKILLVVLYATFFYFMYYMSVNRSGTGTYDFISSLYVYFSGAVAHMSTRLSNFDFEWTYGLTLISGLLRPLMLVVKYLLGTWPNIYQNTIDIGVKLQFPVSINSLKDFNAFVLPFFYFYCDGGILMVLFDSLVYGAVCESFYLNFKHKKTEFSTVLYLLIISGLMCSMVRYNFILVYYTLAFFVVWFIYKKKKS